MIETRHDPQVASGVYVELDKADEPMAAEITGARWLFEAVLASKAQRPPRYDMVSASA